MDEGLLLVRLWDGFARLQALLGGHAGPGSVLERDGLVASVVPSAPDSLKGACEALRADHEFLLQGDVFSKDLIDTLLEMRLKDYDTLRLRPHPIEFAMYYDV